MQFHFAAETAVQPRSPTKTLAYTPALHRQQFIYWFALNNPGSIKILSGVPSSINGFSHGTLEAIFPAPFLIYYLIEKTCNIINKAAPQVLTAAVAVDVADLLLLLLLLGLLHLRFQATIMLSGEFGVGVVENGCLRLESLGSLTESG